MSGGAPCPSAVCPAQPGIMMSPLNQLVSRELACGPVGSTKRRTMNSSDAPRSGWHCSRFTEKSKRNPREIHLTLGGSQQNLKLPEPELLSCCPSFAPEFGSMQCGDRHRKRVEPSSSTVPVDFIIMFPVVPTPRIIIRAYCNVSSIHKANVAPSHVIIRLAPFL